MPRPRKCRRVCGLPHALAFVPAALTQETPHVTLSVDEFEVIRLIDREGLSQEQCGQRMRVARTTVQLIYADARRKLADMLVDGLPLRIAGGDYRLCGGEEADAACGGCPRQRLREQYATLKGETIMRIAVTYENGQIFQHFGHTEQFKLYDVEDGKVVSSQVVSTNGSGHGALAGVLAALKADALICGGIGGGARMALDSIGVKLYGGVSGDADQAVAALLAGALAYSADATCSHHDEHHHEDGSCGEHGCGEHGCGGHECASAPRK